DAQRAAPDRERAHDLAATMGIRLALGPTEYPTSDTAPDAAQ
ncbi:MAG: hypothetical protein JWO77_832, partial [Ilumatobacteraceae bacterium]|nr:hypothetical protein [Ilumatobacteraceae bacterium]